METRYVARCPYCNKGIRRVYRSEVVLDDHKWFCNSYCHAESKAGNKYVRPMWCHSPYTYAVTLILVLLLVSYLVGS